MDDEPRAIFKHYRALNPHKARVSLFPGDDYMTLPNSKHLVFRYYRGASPQWTPGERGGATTCTLLDENDEPVGRGVAECSMLDNFNYRISREIAEKKARKGLAQSQRTPLRSSVGRIKLKSGARQ